MLGKLLKSIRIGEEPLPPIPDEAQSDAIGARIEWRPLKSGGSNFRTHRLVQESPQRAVFQATLLSRLFSGLFFVVGAGITVAVSIMNTNEQKWAFSMDALLPLAFGVVFAAIGASLWYFGGRPTMFDKNAGWYWKGYQKPTDQFEPDQLKNATELDNIHALQLLREYVRSDRNRTGYYSYELNLVLKNGDRLNVIDHGNRRAMREDAGQLAAFLNVPLWDAM